MNVKMCASNVPASLKDSIHMPLTELKMIISSELPTAIRLTRSNVEILQRVLDARSMNQFDYEFDDEDDNLVIEMNYYVPSPRHWTAEDFAELFTL